MALPAVIDDLLQPVLSLAPVALALITDIERVAEVVEKTLTTTKWGWNRSANADQRVIVLLGRVAHDAGIQDRDLVFKRSCK